MKACGMQCADAVFHICSIGGWATCVGWPTTLVSPLLHPARLTPCCCMSLLLLLVWLHCTPEEQMAVLTADAPELLGLLGELTTALDEVRHKVGPLLAEVRAGGLATAGGLSYLEAKHLLLLQYCSCLVVYLLLKAEGKSVKDHPVIGRWVGGGVNWM